MKINGIDPIQVFGMPEIKKGSAPNADVPSFKETLNTFLQDVNSTQKESSEAQKKFLAGEITDVHQVKLKSEEANTGFNMLMELRSKGLDGLKEVLGTKL
jgi:flagellar hook-basal body complex protein FliE